MFRWVQRERQYCQIALPKGADPIRLWHMNLSLQPFWKMSDLENEHLLF